jgi:hypothetical protein
LPSRPKPSRVTFSLSASRASRSGQHWLIDWRGSAENAAGGDGLLVSAARVALARATSIVGPSSVLAPGGM